MKAKISPTMGLSDEASEIISAEQVMRLFGLKRRNTIYDWIHAGVLEGTYRKHRGRYYFVKSLVLKAILDGKQSI